MQLVLDTSGLQVTKKGGSFHVASEKSSRTISPAKLDSIAVTANVLLRADAVRLAIQHRIPILFFDHIGKARARLWSPYFESIATLRRGQVHFCESNEATAWMIDLFALKTEAQIDNLRYLKSRRGAWTRTIDQAVKSIRRQNRQFENLREYLPDECRQQMMGTEGTIARMYWQALGGGLPRPYGFDKRSRRPAEDIFNAALNYLYGMLYSVVEGGLFAAGLDPHLGILHADEFKKPTLAFDLIEPFRPWVDRLLIQQCLNRELKKEFFTKNQYGLFLNKTGKAFIIPLFNDFLRSERNYLQQNSTVKNHIYFLGARLAQRIRATM